MVTMAMEMNECAQILHQNVQLNILGKVAKVGESQTGL